MGFEWRWMDGLRAEEEQPARVREFEERPRRREEVRVESKTKSIEHALSTAATQSQIEKSRGNSQSHQGASAKCLTETRGSLLRMHLHLGGKVCDALTKPPQQTW
jgi:hypothetical protein